MALGSRASGSTPEGPGRDPQRDTRGLLFFAILELRWGKAIESSRAIFAGRPATRKSDGKRTKSLMRIPDDAGTLVEGCAPPRGHTPKDADFTGIECYTAGHVPVAQLDRAAVS